MSKKVKYVVNPEVKNKLEDPYFDKYVNNGDRTFIFINPKNIPTIRGSIENTYYRAGNASKGHGNGNFNKNNALWYGKAKYRHRTPFIHDLDTFDDYIVHKTYRNYASGINSVWMDLPRGGNDTRMDTSVLIRK